PFDLANRARRRRHCLAGVGADAKTVAEAKTVARKIEKITLDAGAWTDVVGGHGLERFRVHIALAVEFAAVQQHRRKTGKIVHGGDEPAAAGFPSRHVERVALDLA